MPLTNVGDRRNFERVDMFLSVRSKILVVAVMVLVMLAAALLLATLVVDAAAN